MIHGPYNIKLINDSYSNKYDCGTCNCEIADLHTFMCPVFILIQSLPSDVSAVLTLEFYILI
jgi:hypothetical protein